MDTIIFVVVNYNNSVFIESLCKSLIEQEGRNTDFYIECIIVDNSTNKDDSSKLSNYCNHIDWVNVLSCPDNPGYFGGLNRGLEEIKSRQKYYVVIGNNDLYFDFRFCKTLTTKSYASDIHAVCPDVITVDGVHQNPHIVNRISSFRRFQFDMYFSNYYIARFLIFLKKVFSANKYFNVTKKLHERAIHMGVGACYVLTKNFFLYSTELYCPVFLYGEEAFLSEQIHSNDGKVFFDPDLKVVHSESGTLSKLPKRANYEYGRKGYPLYRKFL